MCTGRGARLAHRRRGRCARWMRGRLYNRRGVKLRHFGISSRARARLPAKAPAAERLSPRAPRAAPQPTTALRSWDSGWSLWAASGVLPVGPRAADSSAFSCTTIPRDSGACSCITSDLPSVAGVVSGPTEGHGRPASSRGSELPSGARLLHAPALQLLAPTKSMFPFHTQYIAFIGKSMKRLSY
jgi:hypothetical protein